MNDYRQRRGPISGMRTIFIVVSMLCGLALIVALTIKVITCLF